MRIALLLTLCLLALSGCAGRQAPPAGPAPAPLPPAGTLLDSSGRPIDEAEFTALAAKADVILLGETHDSACDHEQQARLLRLMSGPWATTQAPAVGLEMVPYTGQEALTRFNRGETSLADLPQALDWEEVWGYPFDLYEPVFAAARELDLPVYGLNAPHSVVRAVAHKGLSGLSPEERALLPQKIIAPEQAQLDELREVFSMHGAMRGAGGTDDDAAMKKAMEARFNRFAEAQSVWDTTMAKEALSVHAATGRPVAVIAGGGHVENGWGIAHRLHVLAPEVRVLLVMPWRGDGAIPSGYADVLYVCPLVHRFRLGMTLRQEGGRVVVQEVAPDSLAARAGLTVGDVVTRAGDEPVSGMGDLHAAGFAAVRDRKPLRLTVERGGKSVPVSIDLPPMGRP
ncbi:protein of unknown function DUF399 [Desulfovibrio sp. X2]|uniref:ChaN family lipoprotein n=1 Tax=Desulfovibrio sp. X2 TaxID=941449 RepID=UPI000358D72B|nr:ChaN family lipoprotein [Desulfovibrio sp. X2]EPR37090.1 protein of unknown function DUF399 [Desulfovibrio sp. X2]